MKTRILIFLSAALPLLTGGWIYAQQIQPGFSVGEFREILYITARTCALDSGYLRAIPAPEKFRLLYRSQEAGLDNLWELWANESAAVVSIRGTTARTESWAENLYAAMVPAKGTLQVTRDRTFKYRLADDKRAAVHVGWLLGLSYMADDIVRNIDSLYREGIRDFFLAGHSQGGAITYLLTAYLYDLRGSGALPADIRFKTYCSAAPKPGNLYFAYSYEQQTGGGLAFNVVNPADWVPETPVSIQSLQDFNTVNPFVHAGGMIKKMKFPRNIAAKHIYKKLSKPALKAQRHYERYLGKMTSKVIRKYLPDFQPPVYYKSNHYVRTGNTIVLTPTPEYYEKFPLEPDKIFGHHFHQLYLFLLDQ